MKKIVYWVLLILLINSMVATFSIIRPVRAEPKTIYVDDDNIAGPWNGTADYPYQNITSALEYASSGDTIFVKSGIYHEHIDINKAVTLQGENATDTIIDGDGVEYTPIIRINATNTAVINFTIRNTAQIETYGMLIFKTENVSLINNIIRETYIGVMIDNSVNCRLQENRIIKNFAYGIFTRLSANHNIFINNTIMENPNGALLQSTCQNNTFYHNYFVGNTLPAQSFEANNRWDNGYPLGGNYWSKNYTGVDQYSGPNQDAPGSDGIGDTPFTMFGVVDHYPLMYPHVPIQPIASFTQTPETAVKNESITFDASASYDVDGYIASYEWDFGDGNIPVKTEPTIVHAYADYGNYSVSLKVTDNETLTDSITKIVFVRMRISALTLQVIPSTVEIGKSTAINGTFLIEGKPSSASKITIQCREQSQTGWITLVKTNSNGEGAYSYNWTPTNVAAYELQAMWEGNDTTLPTSSAIAELNVVKITSKLTINVNPTTATIGSTLTITGQLTPSKEGTEITISFLHGIILPFKKLTVVETDIDGEYHYNWTPAEPGLYILNANWPGDEHTLGSEEFVPSIYITKLSSEITIRADPENATVGSNVTLSGKIVPARANVNVTIQINIINEIGSWSFTVKTDANGNYTYVWKPSDVGTYQIKASWLGDDYTLSAESTTLIVRVEPKQESPPIYYYAVAILILLIILAIIVVRAKRK